MSKSLSNEQALKIRQALSEARQALSEAGIEPLWDTITTAAFLGVPTGTMDQWASYGQGPSFSKIGRHRRYAPADVMAYVAANRQARHE